MSPLNEDLHTESTEEKSKEALPKTPLEVCLGSLREIYEGVMRAKGRTRLDILLPKIESVLTTSFPDISWQEKEKPKDWNRIEGIAHLMKESRWASIKDVIAAAIENPPPLLRVSDSGTGTKIADTARRKVHLALGAFDSTEEE